MSEGQEIVIVKRRGSHGKGHHGGAWKIAFADFMTALMALFLVLWLVNSTNEKTKTSIARYFNPIKLVDMTTLQKGVHPPPEKEESSSIDKDQSPTGADKGKGEANASDKDDKHPSQQVKAKYSEDALFRDPYAVLAEIAGRADEAPISHGESTGSDKNALSVDETSQVYRDPFAPTITNSDVSGEVRSEENVALEVRREREDLKPAKPATDPKVETERANVKRGAKGAVPKPSPGADKGQQDIPAQNVEGINQVDELTQLTKDLNDSVKERAAGPVTPAIEAKVVHDGVLINLTDNIAYSMFAIGSAEPQKQTVQAMQKIAEILKSHEGSVVIRGFTDGRQYKDNAYDNWRLSTSRAIMAQYMLIKGGLDPRRIEHVEGYADRHLKMTEDPLAAVNRRIEILIRKDKR
ncbi:MotB family protein [Beijerinckia mobilis]|uniref:MotB family protein n=1 Tax=Beijerinckia mobilis TaxID=231434 RepID=UPI0005566C1E|nr:MotB family protein [Beijerinckia mobilis]